MKFEKFVKGCGTHGMIVKRENGDKWLVCDNVGMKVPAGVVNLLGAGEVSEKTRELLEEIVLADPYERVELTEATLTKDGRASDIIRVFSDGFNRVRISNANFGLLEKSDVNLAYFEYKYVDDDFNELINRFLLVEDPVSEIIGFITGIPEN